MNAHTRNYVVGTVDVPAMDELMQHSPARLAIRGWPANLDWHDWPRPKRPGFSKRGL